jgi:hypothetical protein
MTKRGTKVKTKTIVLELNNHFFVLVSTVYLQRY